MSWLCASTLKGRPNDTVEQAVGMVGNDHKALGAIDWRRPRFALDLECDAEPMGRTPSPAEQLEDVDECARKRRRRGIGVGQWALRRGKRAKLHVVRFTFD